VKEKDIQRAATRWLDALGVLWTATANGVTCGPAAWRALARTGVKQGVPDVLVFSHVGRYKGWAIELKSPTGKGRVSVEQEHWLAALAAEGWRVTVATSLDELQAEWAALQGDQMNKAIVVGRLGRDPEVRTTQSGLAVCNLAVATDDREKQHGEWQKVTDWHQVVCFGNDAEFAGKYLSKGSTVSVEGKMKRRKYTTKEGAERESFEIVCDRLQSVGGRSDAAPAQRQPPRAAAPVDFSDDVPF